MQNCRVRKQVSDWLGLDLGEGFDYEGVAQGNFWYKGTVLYPDCSGWLYVSSFVRTYITVHQKKWINFFKKLSMYSSTETFV